MQDHFNDTISNFGSIVAVVLATQVPVLWFFDPLFALLFAIFIVYNWSQTGRGACDLCHVSSSPLSINCR